VEHWHEVIGDPTIADALLDRLVHNAHRIRLAGESMRKTKASLTQEGRSILGVLQYDSFSGSGMFVVRKHPRYTMSSVSNVTQNA